MKRKVSLTCCNAGMCAKIYGPAAVRSEANCFISDKHVLYTVGAKKMLTLRFHCMERNGMKLKRNGKAEALNETEIVKDETETSV